MVNVDLKSKFTNLMKEQPLSIQKKIIEPNININVSSNGRKKLVNFNLTIEQQALFNQAAMNKGFVRNVNGQQVVNSSEFMRWIIDNKVWEDK